MKRMLILLCVLWSVVASAQAPPGYTGINARYDWLAGYLRALNLPAYPTVGLQTGQSTRSGAVLWDSVKQQLRIWNGVASGSWRMYADSVYKINDSTLVVRYGTTKDTLSTFSGGSGGGGSGDMILASAQTNSGIKTFLDGTMKLRNVANTFDGYFVNTNTADRIYTLQNAAGTLAFLSDITGTNSGTNTGDQTIGVTGTTTGITTLSASGGSMTIAGAGINTVGVSGSTITITGTEVDGSTTNELQTWQQTLTTGSTLTGNNSINGGRFNFLFDTIGYYQLSAGLGNRYSYFILDSIETVNQTRIVNNNMQIVTGSYSSVPVASISNLNFSTNFGTVLKVYSDSLTLSSSVATGIDRATDYSKPHIKLTKDSLMFKSISTDNTASILYGKDASGNMVERTVASIGGGSSFTEESEDFTGGDLTSYAGTDGFVLTVANTVNTTQHRIVFINGVSYDNYVTNITGAAITVDNLPFTISTTDVVLIKYSH